MNPATRRIRWFCLAMAASAVIVVFVGFAPTYYLKGTSAPASLPMRVHVHGVLFTAWIVLFFAQSALVAVRRVALHRGHAVSLWGGFVLAASFPARVALGNTDAWQTFARWLIK